MSQTPSPQSNPDAVKVEITRRISSPLDEIRKEMESTKGDTSLGIFTRRRLMADKMGELIKVHREMVKTQGDLAVEAIRKGAELIRSGYLSVLYDFTTGLKEGNWESRIRQVQDHIERLQHDIDGVNTRNMPDHAKKKVILKYGGVMDDALDRIDIIRVAAKKELDERYGDQARGK